MGEEMEIDVADSTQSEKKSVPKSRKRKRASLNQVEMSPDAREAQIEVLNNELDGLFKYFTEVSGKDWSFMEESGNPLNSVIACLLEESDLPFSKLVEKIYDKVKMRQGVSLVSVRTSVLFIGQRSMFGITNADADVLEDSSHKCLWCWETRDLKLVPKTQRTLLNIRRTCRRKIHDRISAVSAMIAALQVYSHPDHKADLMKASEKLVKVLNEAEIRHLVENMVQKSDSELAGKEAKLKEKELVKELERNKRELEKEKRRMDREHLKEKLQKEKEQKRLQDEAEKEEKLREAEKKKQIKRQQEEAEKDQRRREKEEAQLKEKLALKKQATLMERFLKSKTNISDHQDASPTSKAASDTPSKKDIELPNAVTMSMDNVFSLKDHVDSSEFHRLHFDSWNKLGRPIRCGISRHWGMRQKPKATLIRELRLQASSSAIGESPKLAAANKNACGDALNEEKVVDGWVDNIPDSNCNSSTDIRLCHRPKKLLQFDKSHRPAYYGTLSSKSVVIGPRHPLRKDPSLDYDVDSDEEWEEDDPGESLSDCDKDEEEDSLVEERSKVEEEDESEDGFFVPDGYLSENEGVHDESMESDSDGDTRCSPQSKQDLETDEFRILLKQQKYINSLTEQALQKSQPLIISNLMHEKTKLLPAEDLIGTSKLEQMFLNTLSLCTFSGAPIEISTEHNSLDEDQDAQESNSNGGSIPVAPSTDLLDKELSKVVWCIKSCSHGINKVVESLQKSFPGVPKTQLRKKVREISEFVDNRWQVKKEILGKIGVTNTPEKSVERTRGIAAFFSKRCLPPAGGPMKMDETSPQQIHKADIHDMERRKSDIS